MKVYSAELNGLVTSGGAVQPVKMPSDISYLHKVVPYVVIKLQNTVVDLGTELGLISLLLNNKNDKVLLDQPCYSKNNNSELIKHIVNSGFEVNTKIENNADHFVVWKNSKMLSDLAQAAANSGGYFSFTLSVYIEFFYD